MSLYRRQTIVQLRELCGERNIEHEGLTKLRLIDQLIDFDNAPVEHADEQQSDGNVDDPEIEMGGVNDGSDAGDSTMQSAAGVKKKPDKIVALHLQLALAKQETETVKEERLAKEREWERESERHFLYTIQFIIHVCTCIIINIHLPSLSHLMCHIIPTITHLSACCAHLSHTIQSLVIR